MIIILKYIAKIDVESVCTKALSGKEALEIIEKDVLEVNNGERTSYELIFMDCNMPIMDGYETTSKIRQLLYKNNIK